MAPARFLWDVREQEFAACDPQPSQTGIGTPGTTDPAAFAALAQFHGGAGPAKVDRKEQSRSGPGPAPLPGVHSQGRRELGMRIGGSTWTK